MGLQAHEEPNPSHWFEALRSEYLCDGHGF